MTDTVQEKEALETMIDKHGLDVVVDMLAAICFGKASHLETNWQDYGAAKVWDRMGRKLTNAVPTNFGR